MRQPELSRELAAAREHGDLRENAEYQAAMEALGLVMRRIFDLESKLSTARIIDEENMPTDEVHIGATVVLKDIKTGKERKCKLVGSYEVELFQDKVSINAPIAQGLMGHKTGDTVVIKMPAGVV